MPIMSPFLDAASHRACQQSYRRPFLCLVLGLGKTVFQVDPRHRIREDASSDGKYFAHAIQNQES